MQTRALKDAPALLVPLAALWVATARGVALAPLVAAATAALALGLATVAVRGGVRREPALAWLAGLVAWCGVAAALRPVATAPAAWAVGAGVIALALALAAASPRGAAWAGLAVVAAGTLVAGWLVLEAVAVAGRPAGPLGNPNLAAMVALLGLLTVPRMRAGPVVRAGLAVVLLGGVVASGSRGGLLALLAACATWALLAASRRQRHWALGGGAVVVVVLGLVVARERDPLRWERARLWAVAARTALAELPIGCGPGGYGDAALPHNFPRDGEFARYHRLPGVAESDVLQLAATLGLPGLILAGGLAWRVARGAGRRGAPLVAAVAVGALVNTQLAAPVVAWTAVLALSAARPHRAPPTVRFGIRPAVAAVLVAIVAIPTGQALTWPSPGLTPDPEAVLARAEVQARGAGGDNRKLAGAAAGAWQAARLRPRWGRAWRLVGAIALERAGRRREAALAEEAVTAFRRAREDNRNDVWAALGEGQAHRLLGDGASARAAFQAAAGVEPNCVPCWLELATLGVETGDVDQARAALERAEAARQLGRRTTFVSGYERRLATADPELLGRLRASLGGGGR
ncbi:MAG: O-antigen ligase family protein [Acidobacteria bacterium]|nr:O-antigen ligase family protein [Acidobacteriota bacterium]